VAIVIVPLRTEIATVGRFVGVVLFLFGTRDEQGS